MARAQKAPVQVNAEDGGEQGNEDLEPWALVTEPKGAHHRGHWDSHLSLQSSIPLRAG